MLHHLTLGSSFDDLLLEVHSVEGPCDTGVPRSRRDPGFSTALVKDCSGYARLVYNLTDRRFAVKTLQEGRCYLISGKVECHEGHLQLLVHSAYGKLKEAPAQEVSCQLPVCAAANLSTPQHCCSVMLLCRHLPGSSSSSSGGGTGGIFVYMSCGNDLPFPLVTPGPHEIEREASCRAVQEKLQLSTTSFQLLPIGMSSHAFPPAVPDGAPIIHHLCPAMLHTTTSAASSLAGLAGEKWVPMEEAAGAVDARWAPCVRACVEAVKEAAAAGLLLPPYSTSGTGPAAQAAEVPATPQPAGTSTAAAAGVAAGSAAGLESQAADVRVAVTIVSGLPGAGRTELAHSVAASTWSSTALPRCALIGGSDKGREAGSSAHSDTFVLPDDEDLEDVVQLVAELGQYRCILVDNARGDEPAQLAEDLMDLENTVRLDTAVTVVDAATLLADLRSTQLFREHMAALQHPSDECDDRQLADVVVELIEFANVIVVNNIDAVPQAAREPLQELLKALNPGASILTAERGCVDATAVLMTGRFDAAHTPEQAGWLKALQDRRGSGSTAGTSQQVSEQASSSSSSTWVFRARTPFHPKRLHDFFTRHFVLQQPAWSVDGDGGHVHDETCGHGHPHHHAVHHSHEHTGHVHPDGGQRHPHHDHGHHQHQHADVSGACGHGSCSHDHGHGSSSSSLQAAVQQVVEEAQGVARLLASEGAPPAAAAAGAASLAAAAAHAAAAAAAAGSTATAAESRDTKAAVFGQLLRSRGFAWVAGPARQDHCGEWNHVGQLLRFGTGGPWYCVLPREAWPTEPDKVADIELDMLPGLGDRRQELAFIGLRLNVQVLEAALTGCLCTDQELAAAQLEDPFDEWPSVQEMLEAAEGEDEDEEEELSDIDEEDEDEEWASDEEEEEEEEEVPVWEPGHVYELTRGAAELQQLLDSVPHGAVAVVDWHAHWATACVADRPQVEALAAKYPSAVVIRLGVEGVSAENNMLAREKVMGRPVSARESNRPTLKSGLKWPCYSLHHAPVLQPEQLLQDAGAFQRLTAELARLVEEGQQQVQQPAAPAAAAAARPAAAAAVRQGAAAQRPQPSAAAAEVPAADVPLVQQLKRGATDLKKQLQDAQARGMPLAVVWMSSSDATAAAADQGADESLVGSLHAAAAAAGAALGGAVGGPLLLIADIGASAANTSLAAALKVELPPVFHIYDDMKMLKSFKGEGALVKLKASMGELLMARQQQQQQQQAPKTSSKAAAAAGTQAPSAAAAAAAAPPSVWDPPEGKLAKAGFEQAFGDRKGVFWPKMPCLRCGCPWWQGEDWDARCLRCGWDCEFDGYDDDSQPLPKFKAKFDAFMAVLKTGRTPVWSGEKKAAAAGGGVKPKPKSKGKASSSKA